MKTFWRNLIIWALGGVPALVVEPPPHDAAELDRIVRESLP